MKNCGKIDLIDATDMEKGYRREEATTVGCSIGDFPVRQNLGVGVVLGMEYKEGAM